jgi:hypothetical protein
MRHLYSLTAAGLLLLPALAGAKDSCFGTSVQFEDTPSAAARKALKEHKLVFVLHVSGHFEDPRFT